MKKINKQKVIQEVIDKHNCHLEEFWNEDIEKLKINDLESFLDKITEKIGNFGFGETEFHTSDIEFMRVLINKLVGNNTNCVSDEVKKFIKDLKEKFPKNSSHHSSHIIEYIDELAEDPIVLEEVE